MPSDREQLRQYLRMASKDALIEAIMDDCFDPRRIVRLALSHEANRHMEASGRLVDAGRGKEDIFTWGKRIDRHWAQANKAIEIAKKLSEEIYP